MAKDGFLTAKAIGNRIKSKGLQKLRWFCQICEKQCRDENGFKNHCDSESHQRKILLVAESPEKYLNDYSAEFQKDFMKLLSTRYGTRRVNANLVYQEFISDRTHLHMNSTKWATLSEFTMYLGKEGLAIVDETPKGWFMQWIDNSPKTLARQEAILKKERMELDDEQREQRMIQEQIDKALALKQQQDEADGVTTELVRENEEDKIKLDMSIKPHRPRSVHRSRRLWSGNWPRRGDSRN
ncbi:MAG: KIN, antigenic determinant of recA protein-like protein [Linnemannia gamsii]|nr:MAG: KIN, antigenic determinant of recA protein-like protein [Linnemannia gamsii]